MANQQKRGSGGLRKYGRCIRKHGGIRHRFPPKVRNEHHFSPPDPNRDHSLAEPGKAWMIFNLGL